MPRHFEFVNTPTVIYMDQLLRPFGGLFHEPSGVERGPSIISRTKGPASLAAMLAVTFFVDRMPGMTYKRLFGE